MTDVASPARPARIRVWDVPTRLTHWLVVLLVVFSWWTAETSRMEWHRWSGYTLLGLVTFRIYWGFAGSSTARFSEFLRGPRAIAGYLKGRWNVVVGHNPLGALSTVLLLALLFAQVALGLFAVDVDGIESGPLSTHVSFEAGRAAAKWHETVFNLLTGFIALHIAAVIYYVFIGKQPLVAAMVHGKRAFPEPQPQAMRSASVLRLLIGVVLAAGLTWMVTRAFQF